MAYLARKEPGGAKIRFDDHLNRFLQSNGYFSPTLTSLFKQLPPLNVSNYFSHT